MTGSLSIRAAALAAIVFFVGGTAAAAGLAVPPGSGWARIALADVTPSPADSVAPSESPLPTESPSPMPSPEPTPTPGPIIGSPTSPMSAHLSGDVYGYLPYWEMDSSIEDFLDWNALSAISLFSVTQGSTGALIRSAAGYVAITSDRGRRIAATARARGVRVEIAFTSFGVEPR